MKILVTGGAGYVGCSLTEVLSNRKDVSEIIVYDNLAKKIIHSFPILLLMEKK